MKHSLNAECLRRIVKEKTNNSQDKIKITEIMVNAQ